MISKKNEQLYSPEAYEKRWASNSKYQDQKALDRIIEVFEKIVGPLREEVFEIRTRLKKF